MTADARGLASLLDCGQAAGWRPEDRAREALLVQPLLQERIGTGELRLHVAEPGRMLERLGQ